MVHDCNGGGSCPGYRMGRILQLHLPHFLSFFFFFFMEVTVAV